MGPSGCMVVGVDNGCGGFSCSAFDLAKWIRSRLASFAIQAADMFALWLQFIRLNALPLSGVWQGISS